MHPFHPPAQAIVPMPFLATPDISDEEFALFQSLIRREAGLHLPPTKKTMLVSRLIRRLHTLNLSSFSDYYRHIVYGGEPELVGLLDAICTNETWFFRNPRHFDFLREEVVPRWIAETRAGARPRRARVWSAGCSTGEEPFSIAMILLDALRGWDVSVLATDLSTRALERARAATWPLEKSKDIAVAYLKGYMLRGMGSQEGKMKAGPDLRAAVSFARLNLNDSFWPPESAVRLDAVFCRNVLMYLEPACRDRVVRRLSGCLTKRGYLFVGDAEGLNGFDELRMVIPGVYALRSNPDRPERLLGRPANAAGAR
jgi:chemotaxis protein methyltransferase CheR